MLSKDTIEELRSIIRADYQMELNDREVDDVARTLVGYFDVLMGVAQDKTHGTH